MEIMKNVEVLSKEIESTGAAKVYVRLEDGKELIVRNCHLVPKVYFGSVERNNEDGTIEYKSVFLSMDENNNGMITLDEV